MDNATHSSVILHVDLDCFYAAVEHVRLGIPREKPLAVQQWRGLIAINYAARAAGITRHERADQALKKCPDLQLVHVETIGSDGGSVDGLNQRHAKVSLERYRQASASVFSIFRRFSEVYEKASIDEAYLDVTQKIEEMIIHGYNWDQELRRLLENNEQGCAHMVVLDGPLVPFNSYDRRMLAGAIIAHKIRTSVRDELGYTCSVGIATNKLLAKIASAKNKPDRQTLIPPRAVPGLMQTIPLKKMRLLGGKLGEELTQKWGFSTAGDVQALSLATLVTSFGERLGNYIWHAVRGIQADKVQAKQVPKSMLAAKSFGATKELSDIRKWLSILAEELSVRMLRDSQQNHRHPHLLQLYYRSGDFKHSKDHSKSWSMPHGVISLLSSSSAPSQLASEISNLYKDLPHEEEKLYVVDLARDDTGVEEQKFVHGDSAEGPVEDQSESLGLVITEKSKAIARVLEESAYTMFKRLEGTFPCTRLALAATGFQDLAAQGTKSIQHFFSNAGAGSTDSTLLPINQKENSREMATLEIPKGKPKGILKYLSHQADTYLPDEEVSHEALPLNNPPDTTPNLSLTSDSHQLAEEEKTQHLDMSSDQLLKPEKAHMSDRTDSHNSSSSGGLSPVQRSGDKFGMHSILDHSCSSVVDNRVGNRSGHQSDNQASSVCDDNSENTQTLPLSSSLKTLERGAEPGRGDIDLCKVDLKEQLRILADIQRVSERATKSDKQVRSHGVNNSAKRPRQHSSSAGQQSIGKFFHTQSKESKDNA